MFRARAVTVRSLPYQIRPFRHPRNPYVFERGLSDLGADFANRLPGIATGALTGYLTEGLPGALFGGGIPALINTGPGTSALIGAGAGLFGAPLVGAALNQLGLTSASLLPTPTSSVVLPNAAGQPIPGTYVGSSVPVSYTGGASPQLISAASAAGANLQSPSLFGGPTAGGGLTAFLPYILIGLVAYLALKK